MFMFIRLYLRYVTAYALCQYLAVHWIDIYCIWQHFILNCDSTLQMYLVLSKTWLVLFVVLTSVWMISGYRKEKCLHSSHNWNSLVPLKIIHALSLNLNKWNQNLQESIQEISNLRNLTSYSLGTRPIHFHSQTKEGFSYFKDYAYFSFFVWTKCTFLRILLYILKFLAT
jgi:hypothetical protein